MLADGGVDHLQWCARIGQAHERLDESVLVENTQWLAGYGDELLLQSLELAEMVADLRLDQPAVPRRWLMQAFGRIVLMTRR